MLQGKSDPLWYKDAIIYELHVKAFQDSNGDGCGDFRGLLSRLDYVQDLGVNAIWLLPFYPSPLRDDGYDISDYRGIHPNYGSLRDFKAFVREAHRRGLRVITELVVNHTSDQHPWFQAARRAKSGSARRNYYVWGDTDTRYADTRIIFTDTESSNWSWDPVAGAYYWHRFFSHQPDLNYDNPAVVRAIMRVLRYWLDMGVDGLRLDAVPYLVEREGTNCENLPETHQVIKQLRAVVDRHYSDRMLLAEANQWPDDVRPYFGDGDECHMAFHFPLMPRIFMALRREDRRPITEILRNTPEIPPSCQWALFLRNHDELTLEMVTDEERDYMYNEYAKDPRMRINVGIRRRLAPLVDNGRRRIELLNSLLLSFPGTPIIYYGDEIGMGDNIYLGDRDGVRTPMQWTADRNAGFSSADPARLYLPPLMDAVYGYQAINVEAQQRNPSSLLQFMRRLIALRRQHKALGRGTLEFLRPRNRRILAYLRRWRGEVILCVANLARYVQPCELDLSAFKGWTPVEMMGHTEFPPIGDLPYFLTLGPHAFVWFQLEPQARPISFSRGGEADELAQLPVLTLEAEYDDFLDADFRFSLLEDAIRPFLKRQRWFQGKAREIVAIQLADAAKLGGGLFVTMARVQYDNGDQETYALPLKMTRGEAARRVKEEAPASVLAHVRTQEGDGVLYDALADQQTCALLYSAMADGRAYRTLGKTRVQGFGSRALPPSDTGIGEVRRLGVEQSNTSVILDDRYILKLFRRVEEGPNPDLEIGRHLTEHTGFRALAPVLGGIEYVHEGGSSTALAMLQEFVANDGDGWDYFQRLLGRYMDESPALDAPEGGLPAPGADLLDVAALEPPAPLAAALAPSREAASTLGRRTAEFHLALAGLHRFRDFAPVPVSRRYLQGLVDSFTRHAWSVIELLNARRDQLPEPVAGSAHEVLSLGSSLIERFLSPESHEECGMLIRCHGDYHLGQTLRVGDDFILLDFEGEPLRSLAARRAKASPLKDVAGMLRSFDYAASAVLRRLSEESPEEAAARESRALAWETWVSAAFIRGYMDGAGSAPFLPGRRRELDALLGAFLLNKAFYELEYELNNRPDWLPIPLEGIRKIARRGGAESHHHRRSNNAFPDTSEQQAEESKEDDPQGG